MKKSRAKEKLQQALCEYLKRKKYKIRDKWTAFPALKTIAYVHVWNMWVIHPSEVQNCCVKYYCQDFLRSHEYDEDLVFLHVKSVSHIARKFNVYQTDLRDLIMARRVLDEIVGKEE